MNTQIQEDIKQAMRDKNANKLNVLRALKNAISNAALQKGNIDEPVSNTEIMALIRKEISKRQDSIQAFIQTRPDLVDKEQLEIDILTPYLPAEMSDEDLQGIVFLALSEYENPTKKDMGKIIKRVVETVDGRADNKRISAMVGSKLQ